MNAQQKATESGKKNVLPNRIMCSIFFCFSLFRVRPCGNIAFWPDMHVCQPRRASPKIHIASRRHAHTRTVLEMNSWVCIFIKNFMFYILRWCNLVKSLSLVIPNGILCIVSSWFDVLPFVRTFVISSPFRVCVSPCTLRLYWRYTNLTEIFWRSYSN